MSSLQSDKYMEHLKEGILSTPLSQRNFRDYYLDLFSLDSDDTEYIAQQAAAHKLCTQEFNKNSGSQEWNLTHENTTLYSTENIESIQSKENTLYNQDKYVNSEVRKGKARQGNYHDKLFSSDSDEESSTCSSSTANKYIFDLSNLSHKIENDTRKHSISNQEHNDLTTCSDMEISSTDWSSQHSQSINSNGKDYNNQNKADRTYDGSEENEDMHSQQSTWSDDSINYLDEIEIERLQRGTYIQQELSKNNSEIQHDIQTDKIICHNVQNKYEHMSAAEMILKEEITFAALQEPSSTGRKDNIAWSAFKRRELSSARITSYETQHQVILYDAWRWGGKELTDFQSFQNGRLTSIAFEFGEKQQLGIISIYSITASSHKDEHERKMESKLRNTTTFLMNKTIKEWQHKFPNICIMVMGDLQETITTTDRDNIGNYRKPSFKNGILAALRDSHTSIAREDNPNSQYITRFGTEGGRGIDHIMIPSKNPFKQWFSKGKIGETQATNYFPSDHTIIQCNFTRIGCNNKTDGITKTKFDYKKIFRIKVRESKTSQGDIELDSSQFKDSKNFKSQAKLYSEIMKVTGDDSYLSNRFLTKIENRISKLFENLFNTGTQQKVNGKQNKLVKISPEQATQLAYIVKQYNHSIKAVMHELKLDKEHDEVAKAGTTRMSVFKGKGFKLFENLPIPTKLRYMKNRVTIKKRKLENYINWAKKRMIQRKTYTPLEHPGKIFQRLHDLQDSDEINDYGKTIWKEYLQEAEERENHVQAINHCIRKVKNMKSNTTNSNAQGTTEKMEEENNNFLLLEKLIIDKINETLHKTGCHQPFNTQTNTEPLGFLGKNMNEWKMHILHYDGLTFNPKNHNEEQTMIQDFSNAKNELDNLIKRIQRAQSKYKKQNLRYMLASNNIQEFTAKVLPRGREAPVPHNMIFDSTINSFRRCNSETEEMKATSEYHNKWMSPSKAKESCAFAEVVREGILGPRGIRLKPKRIVKLSDIGQLIHNGEKLPLKIKKDVIKAHGRHTASLFEEPEYDCEFFYYPFFLKDKTGTMNDEIEFNKKFMKAILRIPGKARHDGFQMAVLGRFGKRWRDILFNIAKLMLIMRYIPPELKIISRFPIPKPGKSGEYRPISLCHDLYCFLNGICTEKTSKGIEMANILHDMITSYRKGKGCTNLVSLEQAFREDCIESNLPASQVDEDEEKFFDRICTEMILAAMRVCGFPRQGFLEFKANCMDEKDVNIITNKGTANGKFSCGLEQGNPDSPTIANLVILFKHKIWNKVHKLGKAVKEKGKACIENAYKFFTKDVKDMDVILKMMGYCDDNSRFCANKNEQKLISTTYDYIQQTGDLSIVTKIGRKGSKCETHFFNLNAETALKLEECNTTAWNFLKDCPTRERVPIKLCLNPTQTKIYVNKINENKNLSDEEKDKLLSRIHNDAHRHLGITSTLAGKVKATSEKCISKINKRIEELKITYMEKEAQTKCVNMLCTTMHSYAPLQANHSLEELGKCDTAIFNKLHSRRGLSKSDAKNRFSIKDKYGGFGFKSFIEEDVVANSRELEVLLNGMDTDNKAIRARLAAYRMGTTKEYHHNHIRDAVTKLAKFGLYIRDKDEELVNYSLGILSNIKKYSPVGDPDYKDSNKPGIGTGKIKLLDLSMGSKIEALIRDILNGTDTVLLKKSWDGRKFTSFDNIYRATKKAKENRFAAVSEGFSYWEWINTTGGNEVSQNPTDWKQYDMTKILLSELGKDACINMTTKEISDKCRDMIKIDPSKCINWNKEGNPTPSNIYGKIVMEFIDNDSPMIVSTDGSHIPEGTNKQHCTTASMVLCKLDISKKENMEHLAWTNKPTIPLLARMRQLPQTLGTSKSDIAHGECMGVILQEETFAGTLPRNIIMDSSAIRKCAINIRDISHTSGNNRHYIRHVTSGVGKHLAGRLLLAFQNSHKDIISSQESLNHKLHAATQLLTIKLQQYNKITKTWCINNNPNTDPTNTNWPIEYWENHKNRSFHKVNSHQLNENATQIKSSPRYPILTPNLAKLNSNHHADIAAGLLTLTRFNNSQSTPNAYQLPTSNLRFFLTWKGKIIDKGIAKTLLHIFQIEKIKRMKTKATQGLLWRLQEHSEAKWPKLNQHPGWLRSLLGLSNSHTRALYKSSMYRSGAWKSKDNTTQDDSDEKRGIKEIEKIKKLSPCMWCDIQTEAPPNVNQKLTVKGNRLHHFFFCNHKHIRSIRNELDALIENELEKMMHIYSALHGWERKRKLLLEVEAEFLQIQKSNTGRLRKLPDHLAPYKSLDCMCNHLKAPSWEQALLEGKLRLSDIFNCRPHFQDSIMGDELMGTAEGMFLGLVPRKVNNLMEARLKKGSSYDNMPKQVIQTCQKHQLKAWHAIKELLIAKNVCLHRILNETATKQENEWKKQYDLQETYYREHKKCIRINQSRTPTKISRVTERQGKRAETTNIEQHMGTRYCSGITCNKNSKNWNTSNNDNASRLSQKQTQCQRCCKHLTAMRKGAKVLNELGSQNSNTQNTIIQITSQNIHSPTYKPLMNMLHANSNKDKHNKAKFKSEEIQKNKRQKTTISDADKTICKVIISSMQQTSETIKNEDTNSPEQLKKSANLLLNAITAAKGISNTRKNQIQQIQREESERAEQLHRTHENDTEAPPLEKNKIQDATNLRIKLRNPDGLLSGQHMHKAIQELRQHSPGSVYIASPEAMENVNKAYLTSNWRTFGKAFNSVGVANSKPHGTYLIPRFSGEASKGHWTLVVIQKNNEACVGFHIDSLGLSGTKETTFKELENLFSGGRKFTWHNTRSLPQTEMECGFRTIFAMAEICKGIHYGHEISRCIQAATLCDTSAETYDSSRIRLIGTNIITGTWIQDTNNEEIKSGTQANIKKDQKGKRSRKQRSRKRSKSKHKKQKL